MELNPMDGAGLMGARIMGGQNMTPNSLPFMVHIKLDGDHSCGGAILNSLFILTAAHCVYEAPNSPQRYKVTAGDHDRTRIEKHEQERSVAGIIMHEGYNHARLVNDIALLRLSSQLTLNAQVKPIDYQNVPTEYLGRATVSGWGKTSEFSSAAQVAQRADINIQACPSHYETSKMCAGEPGLDACRGDSGGPLTGVLPGGVRIVVGIVSYGPVCDPRTHNTSGIYTNVSKFGRWIDTKISGSTYSSSRCSADQYLCRGSDKCINKSWVCDGENDCGDNEDEASCYKNCTSIRRYKCKSAKKCIPISSLCDGVNDCGDGQDEAVFCDASKCRSSDKPFKCRISGKCIEKSWVCDGERDCSFSEDEENCNSVERSPTKKKKRRKKKKTPPPP